MSLCEVPNHTTLNYKANSENEKDLYLAGYKGDSIKLYRPPLSREEKLLLISSIFSGIGSRAHFCPETIKSRIDQCIKLVEEIL
jgi:hypothetical protein